ncbi:hypothetical protein OG225_38765 [Nocardia sp. NBC_01377]|uniref:hypothetical protein n=1 Tax=Nocardia sp. NBC_01377 TaxID=2903595 RepID=UPI0032485D54
MPQTLPLARTNLEARLFLRLQPCHGCGSTTCDFRSAVVNVAGDLVSRYTGTCAGCGVLREYEFRLPEQVLVPGVDTVRFGSDEPSELLDPGVWLWYSDQCARQVPESTDGLDERGRRAARHTLATALAAVHEVLKFVPDGSPSVPDSAFASVDGRAVYQREPARFDRDRLEAVRDHYANLLSAG